MTEHPTDELLDMVAGRRGHFCMESGYHSALWLDLDPLFVDPQRLNPFVRGLATKLSAHDPEVICGPLVGGAFLAQSLAARMALDFWYTSPDVGNAEGGLFRARYLLPPALTARAVGRRVAIVDDVMSAGSSLRATAAALTAAGALIVAAGALLTLGTIGADHFANAGVAVESVSSASYDSWPPAQCPLCAAGQPLESRSRGAGKPLSGAPGHLEVV